MVIDLVPVPEIIVAFEGIVQVYPLLTDEPDTV
jgi:hypothetical protein